MFQANDVKRLQILQLWRARLQVVRPCRQARNVKTLPKYRDFLWLGKKAVKRKVSGPHQGGLDSGGHAYVYINIYIYIVHVYNKMLYDFTIFSKHIFIVEVSHYIHLKCCIDWHAWNSPASATGQKLLPSPRVAPAISGCWSQSGRCWAIRLVSHRWVAGSEVLQFLSKNHSTTQPLQTRTSTGKATRKYKQKTNYAYYAAVHCRCYSTPSCYPQPSCLSETFLMLVCFRHKQRWATMLQRTQLDRRSWQRMQRQNLTRCSASTY